MHVGGQNAAGKLQGPDLNISGRTTGVFKNDIGIGAALIFAGFSKSSSFLPSRYDLSVNTFWLMHTATPSVSMAEPLLAAASMTCLSAVAENSAVWPKPSRVII